MLTAEQRAELAELVSRIIEIGDVEIGTLLIESLIVRAQKSALESLLSGDDEQLSG